MGSRRVRRVRQEAWPAQELVSKRDRGGGWNSQEKGSRGGQRPGAAAVGRGQREPRSDSARRPQLGAPDSPWQQERWPGGQVRHLWPGEGRHPESQIQIQAWHWRFLHGGPRWVSPRGKAPVGGVGGTGMTGSSSLVLLVQVGARPREAQGSLGLAEGGGRGPSSAPHPGVLCTS